MHIYHGLSGLPLPSNGRKPQLQKVHQPRTAGECFSLAVVLMYRQRVSKASILATRKARSLTDSGLSQCGLMMCVG